MRDPDDSDDDGARTLYVRGWMRGTIADALREVGETEPKPGAVLTVTFTHQEKPTSPGLSGIKKFSAVYKPPPSGVADHFAPPAAKAPRQARGHLGRCLGGDGRRHQAHGCRHHVRIGRPSLLGRSRRNLSRERPCPLLPGVAGLLPALDSPAGETMGQR